MNIKKKIICHFDPEVVEEPIIYVLAHDYNLVCSILKAKIDLRKVGYLIMEIKGREEDYKDGMDFLKRSNVVVEDLSNKVSWKEENCISCGQCEGLCPTSALHYVEDGWNIGFDSEKCIACGMCIKACPAKAMEMRF
ncbi:MAG: 4Fe-4S binding protein [Bacillota bacterium]|nr:4Fe-4S binding protein [Bacillota bacterium]